MAWRIESHCLIILTPFLVMMVNELVRVLPGFIYAAYTGVSPDCYAMVVFVTGFVALIGGIICSLGLMGYRTSMPEDFLNKEIAVTREAELFAAIVFCSLILFLVGLHSYQGVPSVIKGLLGFLKGQAGDEIAQYVSTSRREITKDLLFGGVYRGQGMMSILSRVGWPFLISMALVVYMKTKKIKWLCLICVLFVLSFIFIAGNGTRGPFLNTIIIYIILISFMKRIRIRFVALSLVVIVSMGVFLGSYSNKMYYILSGDDRIVKAISSISERILISNSLNDVNAIELVREGVIKHKMGMLHVRDLQAVFPGTSGGLPFSNELAMILNPTSSSTTFATGTYITKPYVDFGILGVGLIFLFIGLLAGMSQTLILTKTKKDPFYLAIGAMLTYYTGLMVMTSLMNIMSTLLVLLFFSLLVGTVMRACNTARSL